MSVLARLQGDEEESPFGVADYVQLACMGRRCARVHVKHLGRSVGTVTVWHGELWGARDRQGAGESAVGRLMFGDAGSVRVSAVHEDELEERTIHAPWQHVLLEAARLHDEAPKSNRSQVRMRRPRLRSVAPPAARVEVPRPVSKASFDDLFDEGVDALLGRELERAYGCFSKAHEIRPDDAKVEANLARLRAMGYGEHDE